MARNSGASIDRHLPFLARACLVLLFPSSALDKIFDYGSAVESRNVCIGVYVAPSALVGADLVGHP